MKDKVFGRKKAAEESDYRDASFVMATEESHRKTSTCLSLKDYSRAESARIIRQAAELVKQNTPELLEAGRDVCEETVLDLENLAQWTETVEPIS